MTALERAEATRQDVREMMDIIKSVKDRKMSVKEGRLKSEKIWDRVRLRELRIDFEASNPDVVEKPYYKHCCKNCAYTFVRLPKSTYSEEFGEVSDFGVCGFVRFADEMVGTDGGCMLVKEWLRTRQEEDSKIMHD